MASGHYYIADSQLLNGDQQQCHLLCQFFFADKLLLKLSLAYLSQSLIEIELTFLHIL